MSTLGRVVPAVSKTQPTLIQEQTWGACTLQVAKGWLTKAYKEPGVERMAKVRLLGFGNRIIHYWYPGTI